MPIVLALMGCTPSEAPETPAPARPASIEQDLPRHVSLFGTIPATVSEGEPLPTEVAELGRRLFHDPRLSKDERYSCRSCHALERWGTVPEPTSGAGTDAHPPRNAPSVYNAALQFRQFWDARADSIEAAARESLIDSSQMGMETEAAVLGVLRGIPGYPEAFAAAFPGDPDPVRFGRVGQALGAWMRTLTTPSSPLDRYLKGEADALTDAQIEGFEAFVSIGCVGCHSGPLVGGGMLQRFGAVHPVETADEGMGARTGKPSDAGIFKVPSLRNVARTGPWLHDGRETTLEGTIRLMGHHQLGRTLDDAQVASLAAFLGSLTGPLRPDLAREPVLP